MIASYFVFDSLIRLEYFNHRRDWEADGKPHGIFWIPKESTFAGGWLIRLGSAISTKRKSYVWLFSTPAWMKGDRNALRLLFCWRALIFGWCLAFVAVVLLVT
jgi:hypothetical protein